MLQSESTVELSNFPSLKSLLVKLASSLSKKVKKVEIPYSLPKLEYRVEGVNINNDKCHAFHKVTTWDAKSGLIHPCFLHSIAFPLHLYLLLSPDFPFPLLGLIHLRNEITQYRPIMLNESLQFRCKFGELKAHTKGWEFSIKVSVFSDIELVWESSSTNLFIDKHFISNQISNNQEPSNLDMVNYGSFHLESNIGRQYAKCSGDYNPIHLRTWLAKLFGFKTHIAHGMWTKSWCLSMLQLREDGLFENAFSVEVNFLKPLYLPNNIELFVENIAAEADNLLQFSIESQNLNKHLLGALKVL